MSAVTSRCHIHPSALQHPEPIADAFTFRGNTVVSCLMRHRTTNPVRSNIAPLTDAAVGLTGLVATSNSSAVLQIPIAI